MVTKSLISNFIEKFETSNSLPCIKNKLYPITAPVTTGDGATKFRIAVISDDDENSKKGDKNWMSIFRKGWLTYKPGEVRVEFDDPSQDTELNYGFNNKLRGMELSDLVTFNGRLMTCDDKTGEVYELINDNKEVLSFAHLNNGDSRDNDAFKCEWLAVKDGKLHVGSHGREWIGDDGQSDESMKWIKIVDTCGVITNVNWIDKYNALRDETNNKFPGYLIHESAVWSDLHKKWFFMPRKVSKVSYNDKEDEKRCGNWITMADENFENIENMDIGEKEPTYGFSAFRFIPETKDEVFVAVKTEEVDGKVASKLVAYDIGGNKKMDPVPLGNLKFEGIEFI
ncbi:hypothetical protein HELRODRAFT_77501 [Helobdella robusta]|uniref:Apyrase n=1 Tax=Helobdella robusta TaxID=6412 RepID=T1G2Y7_HELRO|nr:hypothetical protein HELRODRAFT_77501 [Helobdella robusta]ESO05491.1 hypothetical protein HELRODRAFT_77501 [Helobdella robusta]